MKITFWSDFACPWCWIGETNLEAALKSLGRTAEFEMKAYELAPNAPKMGGETTFPRLLARGLSWEEAEGRIKEVDEAGAAAGLPFAYGDAIQSNTFDAHRVRKFVEAHFGRDAAEKLSERFFRAYFSDHVELGNPEVLCRLAGETGIPSGQVRAFLDAPLDTGTDARIIADAVREDEMTARSTGVTSVPFFIINGKYSVPGALDQAGWEDGLKQVFEEEDRERQRGPFGSGVTCGPDGCSIDFDRE